MQTLAKRVNSRADSLGLDENWLHLFLLQGTYHPEWDAHILFQSSSSCSKIQSPS